MEGGLINGTLRYSLVHDTQCIDIPSYVTAS